MLTAVTGINWGDEGKGRVIDLLAENADVVVRYQGGNNAGHTVVTDNCKFVLNLLPSGILHPDVTCVLGDGMVVDLDHLENEIESIREKGIVISPQNLKLSKHATISMPWHKIQDELEEDRLAKTGSAFGSTRRGIAYAYSDKYKKKTLRLGDLLHLDKPHIQSRLKTMLEYKIWNWAAATTKLQCLIRLFYHGVKKRLNNLLHILQIPEITLQLPSPITKKLFLRLSSVPCVTSIMEFSHTPQAHQLSPHMVLSVPAFRELCLTTSSVC